MCILVDINFFGKVDSKTLTKIEILIFHQNDVHKGSLESKWWLTKISKSQASTSLWACFGFQWNHMDFAFCPNLRLIFLEKHLDRAFCLEWRSILCSWKRNVFEPILIRYCIHPQPPFHSFWMLAQIFWLLWRVISLYSRFGVMFFGPLYPLQWLGVHQWHLSFILKSTILLRYLFCKAYLCTFFTYPGIMQ